MQVDKEDLMDVLVLREAFSASSLSSSSVLKEVVLRALAVCFTRCVSALFIDRDDCALVLSVVILSLGVACSVVAGQCSLLLCCTAFRNSGMFLSRGATGVFNCSTTRQSS